MAKRLYIGLSLVLASALLAWLASHVSFIRTSNEPRPLSYDEVVGYPDTGLPGVLPQSGFQRAQRIASSEGMSQIVQTANAEFENTISPDEDLLLGVEGAPGKARNTPIRPDQSTQPSPQQPSPQQPQFEPMPTRGSADSPPPESPAFDYPQTDHPPIDHSQFDRRDADPESAAAVDVDERGFDPNAAPAPDEDLLLQPSPDRLQGPSQGDDSVTQPIEVLPIAPDANSDLRMPTDRYQPESVPTPPRQPPTRQPPTRQPTEQRAAPFTPPSHARPLATPKKAESPTVSDTDSVDPHADIFAESLYPSAKKCKTCHEKIYDEWAGSSHAYASISPMFQSFEQTISRLTRGTIGYFCMRCHAPVATAMNHPRESNIFGSIASGHEGVTCIACHRVKEQYGKSNGERRIEPGDVHDPVYGSGYGEGLRQVLNEKASYKVKPYPEKGPGQEIHREVIHFEQISDSSFCVSCHQVFVAPGIELEVVWEQYRASPACKQGISCQDCHMGIEPGMAVGYEYGPVAIVNEKPVSPGRRHSNHTFYGPGYSIAHPGIFPHNSDAEDWTKEEWLLFDYRAGWGTDQFEDALKDKHITAAFPKVWENSDDRYDAREIVDANLEKLRAKHSMRKRLMENSSHIEGPIFDSKQRVGEALKFHYAVTNTANGHNMPSGSLGAQPQLWVNVALTGPNGQHLWESGYVDSNGDIADLHSLDVAAGRVPRDNQLVNYQTKFLTTGVKGTDREMYLPINVDIDQLPFIRPSGFPVTVMNHPPFIRMEAHSIPPLGTRNANYKVPARLIQQPGKYRLSVRMRSRAEPIYFMRFCNATPEMERNMNEWMLDYHEHATEFWVH